MQDLEILDVLEAGHVKATGTSELAEETRRMIRARLDETE